MPSHFQPEALPTSTLEEHDSETLLRLVHAPAGSTFRDTAAVQSEEQQPTVPSAEPHIEQPQLLVGEFSVAVDNKSRLSIPSALVGSFEHGESYLTASSEQCLWLFPGSEFRRIFGELQSAVVLSTSAVTLKTYFASHSFLVLPDPQHRFVIPSPLRQHLIGPGMSSPGRVILNGSGNFVEVWPADKWAAHLADRKAG